MTSSGKRFIENPTDEKLCSTANYVSRIINYEYDAFDRLIKETRTDDGSETLNIEYDYYKNSGNLRKVLNNGNVYKNLHIKMVEKLTFPYGVLIIQLVMIIMEIL